MLSGEQSAAWQRPILGRAKRQQALARWVARMDVAFPVGSTRTIPELRQSLAELLGWAPASQVVRRTLHHMAKEGLVQYGEMTDSLISTGPKKLQQFIRVK